MSNELAGLGIAGILIALFFFLLLLCLIPAFIAYTLLNRVPVQHQKQKPAMAFLLVIPFFGIIWAFFVHPKVAESLVSWAGEKGDPSVGDAGAKLALWVCILPILSIIPILGMVAGIASLVLFILFYVKAFDISKRLALPKV